MQEAIIVYTCPECGADIEEVCLTTYPPRNIVRCTKCDWEYEKPQVVTIRLPYPVEPSTPTEVPYTEGFASIFDIPGVCKNCATHTSSGGSGVCNCTLGTPKWT